MTPEERLIGELSEKSLGAAALARAVSLAVLAEPRLLRRARLELLPGVDAGAEADLWLSPLAQTRGPRGITLLPRAAEQLRRQLARDPGLFERAANLTAEMHAASPPTIRLEEEIYRLHASPAGGSLEEIERLLRSAVSTMVGDEGRWGLAHWAAGALTRLPEEVRGLESARMLAAAAYLRLSSYLPPDSVKAAGGRMPDWLSWVVPRPGEREGQFKLRVSLVEGGVQLGGPADGGHRIPVPDTNPLLVELSWPEVKGEGRRVRQVRLEKGERLLVEAPYAAVRLRTMTGACYELSPASAPAPEARGVCFVSMPFGKKADFRTGRTLDLDKTYRNVIKPAVKEAGLDCIRADEMAHAGLTEAPVYEQLLKADVVISDISTLDPTVLYELGVRHALRPHATLIISEDETVFPFDINTIAIRRYRHRGDNLDYEEAMRFREELKQAIVALYNEEPRRTDSPVYAFLKDLTPPELSDASRDEAEAAAGTTSSGTGHGGEAEHSYGNLMRRAEEAMRQGDFAAAKSMLEQIRRMAGAAEDPYVVRQLALATYKSKQPDPRAALEEARELLLGLNPSTSNDTETVGLWGAVHKRLWEETHDGAHLDEAVRSYRRGFYLRNDHYNGINLAFLLNLRAADPARDRAEAIADFVQARRVRRAVAEMCERALGDDGLSGEARYWVMATMAEALLGGGRAEEAHKFYEEAFSLAPHGWMGDSTREQRERLESLLSDSPLKYLRGGES